MPPVGLCMEAALGRVPCVLFLLYKEPVRVLVCLDAAQDLPLSSCNASGRTGAVGISETSFAWFFLECLLQRFRTSRR